MKFFVISPDVHGRVDGTVQANLLNHLPRSNGVHDCDCVVLPFSYYEDFQWNPQVPAIIGKRRYIVIDFIELGLDWDVNSGMDSKVLGRNTLNYLRIAKQGWLGANDFIRDNPPIAYFSRELLQREVTDWLLPLDFPCYLPLPSIQTKQEFDSRPLDIFWFWGLSHESRPRLHGDIFRNAYKMGYEVLSQINHWEGFFRDPRGRTWATVHAPHWDRRPIQEIMHFNHRSKLSVSLPGAGQKCFRDSECPVGSVPAFWETGISWSFPWVDGHNCVSLRPNMEWEDLYEATQRDDLYDLYVSAQSNIENYSSPNYVHRHIIPSIQKRA
jgi:hypothetical protein